MIRKAGTPSVFILSAPSGGGKSSLARALVESSDSIVTSISHTTRAVRPGETDGVHYFFVDRPRFEEMIATDQFLEYASVFGEFYGTSRKMVENALASGKHVILDIEWQGARQVREALPDVVSVYILPPSLEALAARLVARGRETEEQIAVRLAEAANEMIHYDEYDYIVINEFFEDALSELKDLVLKGKAPSSAGGFDVETLVQSAKNVRLKTSDAATL